MAEINIEGAPAKYKVHLLKGDKCGNANGKIDSESEARAAAASFVSTPNPQEFESFLSYLEQSNFSIRSQRTLAQTVTDTALGTENLGTGRGKLDSVLARKLLDPAQVEEALNALLVAAPSIALEGRVLHPEAYRLLASPDDFARYYPEFGGIRALDQLYDYKLFNYFIDFREYWNSAIVLLSLYVQQALENNDQARLHKAITMGEKFKIRITAQRAFVDNFLRANNSHGSPHKVASYGGEFLPSNYHQALLDLTLAEAHAHTTDKNRAFYQQGLALVDKALKGMLRLTYLVIDKEGAHAVSNPDYFSVAKALIIKGDLCLKLGQAEKALGFYLAVIHGNAIPEGKRQTLKGIRESLLPLAQLKAAEVLLSMDNPQEAKKYLAAARGRLDRTEEKSKYLEAQYIILYAATIARLTGSSEADLNQETTKLEALVASLPADSYLAARVYITQAELYRVLGDNLNEEKVIAKIHPEYEWLYAQETIKSIDALASSATILPSEGEIFEALDQLKLAVKILKDKESTRAQREGDREETGYFICYAKMVQAKLLMRLLADYKARGVMPDQNILLVKLSGCIDDNDLAGNFASGEELLAMTVYNLYSVDIPADFYRLRDLATINRSLLVAQFPDIFDPDMAESEAENLGLIIENLHQETHGSPPPADLDFVCGLYSEALVARGELMLQLADREADPERAGEKLLAVRAWFDDLIADPILKGKKQNYQFAKAAALRASLISREDLTKLDITEIDREVDLLFSALTEFDPGSYLDVLGSVALAEFYLALADKTKDKNYVTAAEELLTSVPREFDYLYAKSRILAGSILARQAEKAGITQISAAIREIKFAADQFEPDTYQAAMADLTLGELYLALADKTQNQADAAQAKCYFASVMGNREFAYLYHKAVVLTASIAIREEQPVNTEALNAAIAFLKRAAPADFMLALAHSIRGESLIQQADREGTSEAAAKTLLKEAEKALTLAQSLTDESSFIYAKALLLKTTLLLREGRAITDLARIRETRNQLESFLPQLKKLGTYLEALAYLTIAQLSLLLANHGEETEANLGKAEGHLAKPQLSVLTSYNRAQALVARIGVTIRLGKHMRRQGEFITVDYGKWQARINDYDEANAILKQLSDAGKDVRLIQLELDLYHLALEMANGNTRRNVTEERINALIASLILYQEKGLDYMQAIFEFELKLKAAALLAEKRRYLETKSRLFGEEGLINRFEQTIKALGAQHHWDTSYLEAELYYLAALVYVKKGGKENHNRAEEYAQKAYRACEASSSRYTKEFFKLIIKKGTEI